MKKSDYKKQFNGYELEALKRAWLNRDFEIELYWKRATYFWTLIAAAFIGYVTLVSSDNSIKGLFHSEYLITCLGFVLSLSWILVNYGSKRWQENWEAHIDFLEDNFTGPIYKTIIKPNKKSYSVTRINLAVSYFVSIIWFVLGARTSILGKPIDCKSGSIDWFWLVMTLSTIAFSMYLTLGYGRSKKTTKKVNMILRKTNHDIRD